VSQKPNAWEIDSYTPIDVFHAMQSMQKPWGELEAYLSPVTSTRILNSLRATGEATDGYLYFAVAKGL
jgi:hypothetical protein